MTTSTVTLTSFLLARIAEDESVARRTLAESDLLDWSGRWSDAHGLHGPADGPSGHTSVVIDPARVLAECEAKRRIVDDYLDERSRVPLSLGTLSGFECALEHLACVYADHPDFLQEWTLSTDQT